MTNHDPIAYIYEADTHCPGCAEDRFGRTDDGYIAGENENGERVTDREGNPVGAVFSWEAWWQCDGTCETLSCGTCHSEIDRAHNFPHSPDCDEFEVPDEYLDRMVNAYAECTLWSSLDDAGEPLDAKHDESDITEETLSSFQEDCEAFARAEWELVSRLNPGQVGHDFWLTRNGHGTGFWDRGLGVIGKALTEACKPYGEVYLYVGDNGEIDHG